MKSGMLKSDDKHNRILRLKAILDAHPEGMRRAELARRLGVHRSTIGRYIDELSLKEHLWEKDHYIGLGERNVSEHEELNPFEGTFLLYITRLAQSELNIKNPHASSMLRKIGESFRLSSPLLCANFHKAAEAYELEDDRFLRGWVENYEKITAAWLSESSFSLEYLHKSTDEICTAEFRPADFFTARNSDGTSDLAIAGRCLRACEDCTLNLLDFVSVKYPDAKPSAGSGGPEELKPFCPVSEIARNCRPARDSSRLSDVYTVESNHRIKNSLNLVSGLVGISFQKNGSSGLDEKIRQFQGRIAAISAIHEQLTAAEQGRMVSLKDYFSRIVDASVNAHSLEPEKVNVQINIDDIRVDSTKTMCLGMITAELMTNSFKHSQQEPETVISLSVRRRDGILRMRYGDGSDGLRTFLEKGKTGKDLFYSLCRQLDCKIYYKNTSVYVEFSL